MKVLKLMVFAMVFALSSIVVQAVPVSPECNPAEQKCGSTTIPEPGSIELLAISLGALVLLRRRVQKKTER